MRFSFVESVRGKKTGRFSSAAYKNDFQKGRWVGWSPGEEETSLFANRFLLMEEDKGIRGIAYLLPTHRASFYYFFF